MSKKYNKTKKKEAKLAKFSKSKTSHSDMTDSIPAVTNDIVMTEESQKSMESDSSLVAIGTKGRKRGSLSDYRANENKKAYTKRRCDVGKVAQILLSVAIMFERFPDTLESDISLAKIMVKDCAASPIFQMMKYDRHVTTADFTDLIKKLSQLENAKGNDGDSDNEISNINKKIRDILYGVVYRGYLRRATNGNMFAHVFKLLAESETINVTGLVELMELTDRRVLTISDTISALKEILDAKRKSCMTSIHFKLTRISGETDENYGVRLIGLRPYHYKTSEESESGFDTMENILPEIHAVFEGRSPETDVKKDVEIALTGQLVLKELDIPENINDDIKPTELEQIARVKCTLIRKCNNLCPEVDKKMFGRVIEVMKKLSGIKNMKSLAESIILLQAEVVPDTDITFFSFLEKYYKCFSGIRTLSKKFKSCLNISSELLRLMKVSESGSLEEQNNALLLTDLNRTTLLMVRRKLPIMSNRLNQQDAYRLYGNMISQFRKELSITESEACDVCHKLTLESEIVQWASGQIHQFLPLSKHNKVTASVCRMCRKSISDNQMPADAVVNQMEIEAVPECLTELNWIEKAMIQIMRPIQSVVHLRDNGGRKTSIKAAGGVLVLVPVPIQGTIEHVVNTLPSAKHMRIIVDAGFQKKIVSLEKMIRALKWLKQNNSNYENITINEAFSLSEDDTIVFKKPSDSQQYRNLVAATGADDKSLVQKTDIEIETIRDNDILNESMSALQRYTLNKTKYNPQPFSSLENIETLVFPGLFPTGKFGTSVCRKPKIQLSKWIRQRLLNVNRQVAQDSDYLCFEFGRKTQLDVTSAMGTNARINRNSTGKDIFESLQKSDSSFETRLITMFSEVRGFPTYWLNVKKELNSHVVAFGIPQFFLTLNPNEDHWIDLHKVYGKVTGKTVNKDSIRKEIGKDPVIWTRYFNRRVQLFMRILLIPAGGPLGKVLHWFWRVEYQHRGTEHIHMVLWTEDRVDPSSSPEEIAKFLDRYLTARQPAVDETELFDLVEFQKHWQNHSKTCLRYYTVGGDLKCFCRFEFPRPESASTVVYVSENQKIPKLPGVRSKEYSLARTSEEIMINDYNAPLLIGWGGNMDIQAIIHQSSPVFDYICGYTTKSETSKNKSLTMFEDTNEKVMSEWNLGLEMMNKRQAGTPEICDILLGHHLFGFDSDHVFINTNTTDNRHRRLIQFEKLKESGRVTENNAIDDYYPHRSDELRFSSLFNFMTQFETVLATNARDSEDRNQKTNTDTTSPFKNRYNIYDEHSPFYCFPEMPIGATLKIKNVPGKVSRKKRGIVPRLYWPTIDEGNEKSVEDFYRRLVFLFVPWNNEENLLPSGFGSFEERWKHYYQNLKVLSPLAYEDIETFIGGLKFNAKRIANSIQEKKKRLELYKDLDLDTDISDDDILKMTIRKVDLSSHSINISLLNKDQSNVFHFLMDHIRKQIAGTRTESLSIFVSGTAGTGKSHLIQALADSITIEFSSNGFPSVLLAAPTGLAAIGIKGLTLHKLLCIEVQKGKQKAFAKLTPQKLEFLRSLFKHVNLIIIDEISMCSNVMLHKICRRLMEISGRNIPFGGFNLCVFGDLLQLPPVSAQPVFSPMTGRTVAEIFSGITSNWTLWPKFIYFELTENMRQKDDLKFAEIMGRVRVEAMDENDHKTFRERIIEHQDLDTIAEYYIDILAKDSTTMALMPTNEEVLEFNEAILDKLGLLVVKVEAIETDTKTHQTLKMKEGIISRPYQRKEYRYQSESFTKKECKQIAGLLGKRSSEHNSSASEARSHGGLEKVLCLAEGARVMLKRNVDIYNGLVNGARGYLKKIEFDINGSPNNLIIVFDGESKERTIGKVTAVYDGPGKVKISRTQFPVGISFAASVHKCQGLTLQNAIVSMSKMFSPGQAYVALSRCKNLEGLHLINYNPSKIKCCRDGLREYNRLRESIGLGNFPIPVFKARPKKTQTERVADMMMYKSATAPLLVRTGGSDEHPKPLQKESDTQSSESILAPSLSNSDEYSKPLQNESSDALLSESESASSLSKSNDSFAEFERLVDTTHLSLKNRSGTDCWLIAIVNTLYELPRVRYSILKYHSTDEYTLSLAAIFKKSIDSVSELRKKMPSRFLIGYQDVADATPDILKYDEEMEWKNTITLRRKTLTSCGCDLKKLKFDSYNCYESVKLIQGNMTTQQLVSEILINKDRGVQCSKCGQTRMKNYVYCVDKNSPYIILIASNNMSYVNDFFETILVEFAGCHWRSKGTIEYVNDSILKVDRNDAKAFANAAKSGHWICHFRSQTSSEWLTMDDDRMRVTETQTIDTRRLKVFVFEKTTFLQSTDQIDPNSDDDESQISELEAKRRKTE